MHTLVFTAFFEPHKNGIARYIRAYADALKKYDVKTSVVCFQQAGQPLIETRDGIDIYRLPCRMILGGTQAIPRWGSESYQSQLVLLRELTVDVVMTHTRFFLTSLVGRSYAKKKKVPFIHIEHGNTHIPHPNPLIQWCAWIYDHTLGRFVMRSADKVIAISKAGIAFCTHLGAREQSVVYIPNAIPVEQFSRKGPDLHKELKLRDGEYLLVFVGRLIHAKGVQDLLEALTGITHTRLLVIGDGPYRAYLAAKANDLGVKAAFVGEKDITYIQKALRTADVFVNPSHAEGLPTTVIEAAVMGVPVIATNVGGTSEILPADCLVPPRNVAALRAKIQSMRKARQDGTMVEQTVHKQFGIEQNAKHMYELLLSL